MKKLLLFFLLPLIVFGGALVTGQKIKFIPGDKVLFSEDFSKCPVGEIPVSFDKIKGGWECVKYANRIWLSPNTASDSSVEKNLNLPKDEYSIEFDINMNKPGGWFFIELYSKKNRLFKMDYSKGSHWCNLAVDGQGVIHSEDLKKCTKKTRHIALQVRRQQLRVFYNGKRVANYLWNKDAPAKLKFSKERTDSYSYLISNIKVAVYSKKEEKPKPEKVGISVQKIKGGEKLTVPEKVLFDFNKFILKPKAKDAIKVVGAYIAQNNPKKIIVTGYTDNVGSDEYNLKLSLQRAQSVADFLIYCANIDTSKIEIKGLGKANPIAPNDTKEKQAKNRRVEIKLLN